MYPIVRIAFGVVTTVILVILMSNCQGFFTGPEDEPYWIDPPGLDGGSGGGGSAGGPGAVVFAQKCAACHQGGGQGIEGVYPSLIGSEFAQGNEQIPIRLVLHGFRGSINRNGVDYNGIMTPFKDDLSDKQIADVLTYVRSSWGNSAPGVDEAMVSAIREETLNRLNPYTEAEVLAEAGAVAGSE